MSRLLERYRSEIRPGLREEFEYANLLEVPELKKITINMGIGKARENPKLLEDSARDLTTIAGQKAVVTKAKRSIFSNFHRTVKI